ncbi:hypothetical protein V1477_001436 [Vespula maculifrons]|uniref:Uncharacterized protein n=1 Tax=Vespula maculifrons TaxID=7453 RepID=A0ABD2D1U1_VESMC
MFNYHVERRNPCIFFERNYNSDIALSNSANSLGSSAILLGSWNFFHFIGEDLGTYLRITRSKIIERMTSASEFPPQIAMLDD